MLSIDAALAAPQAISPSSCSCRSRSSTSAIPPLRTAAAIPSRRLRRRHRSQHRLVLVAASPPPPNSDRGGKEPSREFDVGRLWKEGGGVELTPEEAAVLREAAAKFSNPTTGAAVLPAALLGKPPPFPLPPSSPLRPQQPQHSALRDRAQFDRLHASSVATPSAFFGNLASGFEFRNPPSSSHSKQSLVSSSTAGTQAAPPPPWFVGGRLNVALNCLDRHVDAGRGAQPAFVWACSSSEEGEESSSVVETLSYEDAASKVAELAAWLSRSAGVGAGDSVAIMLPPGGVRLAPSPSSPFSASSSSSSSSSSPLLALAFLAVARVGGAALLLDPSAPPATNGAALASSGARVAVTASGGRLTLGGPLVPIKERLDAAADACFESHGAALETALCFEAEGVAVAETPWRCSRDVWSGAALGSTLIAYPGAGLLVCSGVASRLSLDASSEARVAVASSDPFSEAAVVFGILGPLANGGAAVSLPPPRGGGGGSGSAGGWWALADKTKTTHVVCDTAAASWLARSASASGGAPGSVEVAMVVDAEPARAAVEALSAAVGDREVEVEVGDSSETKKAVRRPVVAAWMPAGAGCPLLASAPLAAEASKAGGMLPWLGCAPFLLGRGGDDNDDEDAKEKKNPEPANSSSFPVVGRPALAAAWPSMARSALGPDAQGWLRDSVLCGPRGEFSPPAALFEVNDEGEWFWAEAGGGQ